MAARTPLAYEAILAELDHCLEVEFTFLHSESLAASIADLPADAQHFLLDWTRRAAATSTNLAFEFAQRALTILGKIELEVIASWCLHAMDNYDRSGLHAAMLVIRDLDGFLVQGHQRATGSLFESSVSVLNHFVQGLDGRQLKVERDETAWTNGEVLYLPGIMAHFDNPEDNFQLYKAHVAQLWAQTRCGTLNIELAPRFAALPDPAHAQALFHRLEVLRLNAFIAHELPGLYRTMHHLSKTLGDAPLPAEWHEAEQALGTPGVGVEATLDWMVRLYDAPLPAPLCYQGKLRPEATWAARQERLARDRDWLRQMLRVLADEILGEPESPRETLPAFELKEREEASGEELLPFEITLQDAPVPVPEAVRGRLTSVILDLGEIPPEYLVPAGDSEYDPDLFKKKENDGQDVWSGTYHEEGAFFYNEWDHARQAYKKDLSLIHI